jgi:hypothetical protein
MKKMLRKLPAVLLLLALFGLVSCQSKVSTDVTIAFYKDGTPFATLSVKKSDPLPVLSDSQRFPGDENIYFGGYYLGETMYYDESYAPVVSVSLTENIRLDAKWIDLSQFEFSEGETCEITKYVGNQSEVEIPKYYKGKIVDTIGDEAFLDQAFLSSIVLPDSIKRIGAAAFENCRNLNEVILSEGLEEISLNAFKNCSSLTDIVIPESVFGIADGAFDTCGELVSVTLPSGLTRIGNQTFSSCFKLENINVPNGVVVIGEGAFYNCFSLTAISLPDNLTSIGNYAFRDSALTAVVIPDSVTSIADGIFRNCSSLAAVSLPNNLTSIGLHAFSGCSSLTSVEFPDSLTSIDVNAFQNCLSLATVKIGKNVSHMGFDIFDRENDVSLDIYVAIAEGDVTYGWGFWNSRWASTGCPVTIHWDSDWQAAE